MANLSDFPDPGNISYINKQLTFSEKSALIPKVSVATIKEYTDQLESYYFNREIDPPIFLKNDPIYISGGEKDETIHPQLTNMQDDVYLKYEANTSFSISDLGHSMPKDFPKKMFEHLYYNLADSGFNKESNPVKDEDPNWFENGYVYRFDQNKLIESQIETYMQVARVYDPSQVDLDFSQSAVNQLAGWGYVYAPKACVEPGAQCLFQLSLPGCGGANDTKLKQFAPIASANNVVMAFPKQLKCWEASSTGDIGNKAISQRLKNTKYSF